MKETGTGMSTMHASRMVLKPEPAGDGWAGRRWKRGREDGWRTFLILKSLSSHHSLPVMTSGVPPPMLPVAGEMPVMVMELVTAVEVRTSVTGLPPTGAYTTAR